MPNPKLTITAQQVFDKLKEQEVLVKMIDSQDNSKKDWQFYLKRLADPGKKRSPRNGDLRSSAKRSKRYNPRTGSWDKVQPSAVRGQDKPHKKHIKKTSLSLAPHDGVMTYCNWTGYTVGMLFDINECDLKSERYVFKQNASTNDKWWIKNNGGSILSSISVDDLRKVNTSNRNSGVIAKWNEVLGCPSKESVIGIRIKDKTDIDINLNAIYRQALVYQYLGRYVPIIIMGHTSPSPCEYTELEIQADLAKVEKGGSGTYAIAYEFYKWTKAILPNRNVAKQCDLLKLFAQIKANDPTQQDYLDELFSVGYLFDTEMTKTSDPANNYSPLRWAIHCKNVTFIQNFIDATQTAVHKNDWEALLLFWLDNPALMTCDTLMKKQTTLDITNVDYKNGYIKILQQTIQKSHIELLMFLLEKPCDIDNLELPELLKHMMQVEVLQNKAILAILLKLFNKDFLAVFEEQLMQADSQRQLELIKCTMSHIKYEDYINIFLKPVFILNPDISKELKKSRYFNQVISDDKRPQLIQAATNAQVNEILDEIFTNDTLFFISLLTPGLFHDLPRLHQLSQEDLTDQAIIDKIQCYLNRGWSVFTKIAGKTFVESLFEQANGEDRAIKLIELIPLPESYLLYLQGIPELVALHAVIESALDKNKENNKKILAQLTFQGKANLHRDKFDFDNGNHTLLQHMIVNGKTHLLYNWLNSNNKINTELSTHNTNEDLLQLALKQKRELLFSMLFNQLSKMEPVFIENQIGEYIEIFLKNNQISECISWLKSCPGDFEQAIFESVFAQELFTNDNTLQVYLFSDVDSIKARMDAQRLEMIIALARKNGAINSEELLIKQFVHRIKPHELYAIFQRSILSNKAKIALVSDAVYQGFWEKDKKSLCTLFEDLLLDGTLDKDILVGLLQKNIFSLLMSEEVVEVISAVLINNLDEFKTFVIQEINYFMTNDMKSFAWLLDLLARQNQTTFEVILSEIPDGQKINYIAYLLQDSNNLTMNARFFAKILKESAHWQYWTLAHYDNPSLINCFAKVAFIAAVYQSIPEFSMDFFRQYFSSDNLNGDKANITIAIYDFCFSKDSNTKQWIFDFCQNNTMHFMSYSARISLPVDEILLMAFEYNLNFAELILRVYFKDIQLTTYDKIKLTYDQKTLKGKIQALLKLLSNRVTINLMIEQFSDYLPDDLYPILKQHEMAIELSTTKRFLNHQDARVVALMQEIFLHKLDVNTIKSQKNEDIYLSLLSNSNKNLARVLKILATNDDQFKLFAMLPNQIIDTGYQLSLTVCPQLATKIRKENTTRLTLETLTETLETQSLPQDQQAMVMQAIAVNAKFTDSQSQAEQARYRNALAKLNNGTTLLLLGDSFCKEALMDLAIQCYQFAIAKGEALGHYKLVSLDPIRAVEHSKSFILTTADTNSDEYKNQLNYLQGVLDNDFKKIEKTWLENPKKTIKILRFFMPIVALQEQCLRILDTAIIQAMARVNVSVIQQLNVFNQELTKAQSSFALSPSADKQLQDIKLQIESNIKNTRFQEKKPIALTQIDEAIKPSQLLQRFMMYSQTPCDNNQKTMPEKATQLSNITYKPV